MGGGHVGLELRPPADDEPADEEHREARQQAPPQAVGVADRADDGEHEQPGEHPEACEGEADRPCVRRKDDREERAEAGEHQREEHHEEGAADDHQSQVVDGGESTCSLRS